jgi:hypothetical protein
MKTHGRWIVWAMLVLACWQAATAAPELAGTWQGKLQVDPKTAINIRFIFTRQPNGGYTAVLDSPDNGAIKNVAASAVTWDQSSLKVQVPALSGNFAGTLKGSSIDGQWTQEGSALPLTLSPYQKPVLSKAAIETLSGDWHGPLALPGGGTLTFVARFKLDDHGQLQGSLAVPEQGGQLLPMSEIEFTDSKLSFKIPVVAGQYTADYKDGAFVGSWRQGPVGAPSLPVTLKKGEAATPVYALKLSSAQFEALSGTWEGTLNITGPQGSMTVPMVLHFETDKQAHYVGSLDITPPRGPGAKGIPVTEASLAKGKLDLKASTIFAEYTADVSGTKIVGQWKQGPQTIPLTLTRK